MPLDSSTMMREPETETPGTRAAFHSTHWSAVVAAGDSASAVSSAALEDLCRTYWFPLYAYLRRQGHSPHDAQDLTQAFLASLLARDSLRTVAPEKGRFRTFLLAALNHFLSDARDKAGAQKRGGGQVVFALDDAGAEHRYESQLREEATPDQLYDYHWALSVIDRSFQRLKAEQDSASKTFAILQQFLVEKPAEGEYEAAASALGMSNGAIRVAVNRLRRRYRELVTEEIGHLVSCPEDVPGELRLLLGQFRR